MNKTARLDDAPNRAARRVRLALIALLASCALLGCTSSMEQTPPATPDPAVTPAPTQPAAAPTAPPAAPAASPANAATPPAPAAAPSSCAARIARVWHGRTTNDKAETYAAYISSALPKFRTIQGNLGYQLMRETVGAETHFMVISYWRSRDDIRAYAGDDIRKTRHLPRDAELLIDPEQTVMNYDLAVINLDCPR
ncbi:antibiotic biosynthesis monooxygenase family protein [Sorangium sp. So ce136]|uniref:antibiotic biosynthesis monooxygenase family protein n=1 Tax=Sorangium sp. So ce136 TaxID=3133284 RepID=UPI003F02966C